MLVECGLVRVTAGRAECTFRPSLGRIAALASPPGLVDLYARLHGPGAAAAAVEVLAGLCDPDNVAALPDLIGGEKIDPDDPASLAAVIVGAIPADELVILARHLLQHGMVGRARPGGAERAAQGRYSDTFNAGEYIAAARVHIGLSGEEAEALSMTELQQLLEMKFPPEQKTGGQDVPTAEEYEAGMRAFEELRARRAAGRADHG